jgi:hypothetical protein
VIRTKLITGNYGPFVEIVLIGTFSHQVVFVLNYDIANSYLYYSLGD